MRFGDGELAIMQNREHRSADAWTTTGPVWLRDELVASLAAKLDGYCVGLPSPCCLSRGLQLRSLVNVPLHAQTFATIFMHGNLPRVRELFERFADAVVVHSRYGEVNVPADGVTRPFDVDAVVGRLLEIRDRPILLAAGPASNLIALRYWNRQDPRHRVTMLDIGSALDVFHGDNNRYYHGTMNDHHCSWYEENRPERSAVKIREVAAETSNRLGVERIAVKIGTTTTGVHGGTPKVFIGQPEVTEGLSIQRTYSRQGRVPIRIGKRGQRRHGR